MPGKVTAKVGPGNVLVTTDYLGRHLDYVEVRIFREYVNTLLAERGHPTGSMRGQIEMVALMEVLRRRNLFNHTRQAYERADILGVRIERTYAAIRGGKPVKGTGKESGQTSPTALLSELGAKKGAKQGAEN